MKPDLAIRRYWRAAVLGSVGLFFGYWGPLHYEPSANQGPLVGILITGPVSFLLGLGFERLAVRWRLHPLLRESAFVFAAVLVAAATLWLIHPGYEPVGTLVEGKIVACESPAVFMPRAVQEWAQRLRLQGSVPPAGWEAGVVAIGERYRGAVVETVVLRSREVNRRRAWGPFGAQGGYLVAAWENQRRAASYLTESQSNSCEEYRLGQRRCLWATRRQHEASFPPASLPELLGFQILEPVPPELLWALGDCELQGLL